MVGPLGHFRVDVRREGPALVVAPRGEIDLGTVDQVRQVIDREHDGSSPLVIDLRGVTFLDTSGLRMVVAQNNRADDRGHTLTIVRGPAAVQRVFEIAGLEPKLPFADEPGSPGSTGA